MSGMLRVALQEGDGIFVAGGRGRKLDGASGGQSHGQAAGRGNLPKVAAVDVALVGRKDHVAPVGGQGDVLHFELAGREQRGVAAGDGDGIEVRPAVALPGEYDSGTGGPQELIAGGDVAEDAAGALAGAPEFAPLAGLRGRDAD